MLHRRLLLLAILAHPACDPLPESAEIPAGPAAPALTLSVKLPERLEGEYSRDDRSLKFTAVSAPQGRTLQLNRRDGVEILTLTLNDGGSSVKLFGTPISMGKDPVSRSPGADESAAFEAFAQSEEFGMLGALAESLDTDGVRPPQYPAAELIRKLGQVFRPLSREQGNAGASEQALNNGEGPGGHQGVCLEQRCLSNERFNEETCQCEEYESPVGTFTPTWSHAYKTSFTVLFNSVELNHTYACLDGTSTCKTIRGFGVGSEKSGGTVIPGSSFMKSKKQECLAEERATNNPLRPCGLLSELYGINGVCHQHTSRTQLSPHNAFINPSEVKGGRWSFGAYGAYGIGWQVCRAESNLMCAFQ